MRQAVGYAAQKTSDTLPIVVLHEKGKRADNDLVVMRRCDFVEWYGGLDE